MNSPRRAFGFGAAAGAAMTLVAGAVLIGTQDLRAAMYLVPGVAIAALLGSRHASENRLAFLFAAGCVTGVVGGMVAVMGPASIIGFFVMLPWVIPAALAGWLIGRVVQR